MRKHLRFKAAFSQRYVWFIPFKVSTTTTEIFYLKFAWFFELSIIHTYITVNRK